MDQTQERLLGTAVELFSTQGYAGVSMRDIARAMGFTQAAIYHHFPNKDALYIAAITYLFEQRTQGIGEQISGEGDPAHRLELLIASMLETMEQDPRFRRIFVRELLEGVATLPTAPYYHYAPDASALEKAFEEIADELSELRLSQ